MQELQEAVHIERPARLVSSASMWQCRPAMHSDTKLTQNCEVLRSKRAVYLRKMHGVEPLLASALNSKGTHPVRLSEQPNNIEKSKFYKNVLWSNQNATFSSSWYQIFGHLSSQTFRANVWLFLQPLIGRGVNFCE